MNGLTWQPLGSDAAAVLAPDGRAIARYEHGRQANHPYFRDLTPLNHRGLINNHAPWDHSWHHGLWWSWKFINDILFWEDNPDFGGNRAGLGRALVVAHQVVVDEAGVTVDERLEWRTNATGQLLLGEQRRMRLQLVPELADAWSIDWQHEWTAEVDCRLDTTPYPEHWWGGYAGLNFRAARSMRDGEKIAAYGGRSGRDPIHGEPARWATYSGNVDGAGTDDPAHPARGSFAIFDHPANGTEMPVYVFSAADEFGFLAAAPLMHQNLEVPAGQAFARQFQTLICGSDPSSDVLDTLSAAYRDTPTWKETL